jgi:tryptophan synthase alpha chain
VSDRGRDGPHRVETAIGAARDAGRPAIAAFLTAGFPDRQGFGGLIERAAAEADIVEVGVPFSDPMADGVTIQRASRAALAAGVTLDWILEQVAGCCRSAPIILMSYLNPLLAFGVDRLGGAASDAGVAGFVIPDLPFEEGDDMRAACDGSGLALVQIVTPLTPDGRLARLCDASRGFVYAVTTAGTTGGRAEISQPLRRYLERVRRASPLPVLAGFGVRDARQVRDLAGTADGVVVGSALVEALERGADPAAFLRDLRQAAGGRARE